MTSDNVQPTPPPAPYDPTGVPAAPAPQSPAFAPEASPLKPKKNVVAIIAFIASVLGFLFAVIPGAFGLGWFLLGVAFILAIVSLFQKGKKALGVWALVISIVGSIAGGIAFFVTVANAVDEAFGGSAVEISEPGVTDGEAEAPVEEAADEPAAAEAGSRENPLPIGSTVSTDEWAVTINSVSLAATDAVMGANQFNEAPEAGSEYVLVNATITYTGSDSGMPAVGTSIDYVTADGVTLDAWESFAVAPDAIDTTAELYPDAAVTGNIAIAVPSATAGDGVLAVKAGLLADPAFVAVT